MTRDRWSPPKELAEYRLSRLLGTGAMGQVYLAHDTVLDRHVAIKFIAALDPSSALRERFLVEARAIARIQHPNVVSIYRVGELDDRPYLISEFIRGTSLDKLEKPIAWTRALELGIGLARGLAAAHRRGVLHRDIKTANAILADNGDVKLVDFGLAKVVDRPASSALDTRDFESRDLESKDLELAFASKPEHRAAPAAAPPGARAAEAGSARIIEHDVHTSRRGEVATVSARPALQETMRPPSTALEESRRGPALRETVRPPSTGLAETVRPALPETVRPALAETVRPPEGPPAAPDHAGLGAELGAGLGATRVSAHPEKVTSNAGGLMGTPFYLAPELWDGRSATRRSDVYSLGVLLYELCTGNPPFGSCETLEELRVRVQNEPPCPIRERVPAIDPRFAAVIDRCLSRTPEERFGSGDELRDALEQISLRQSALAAAIPEGNPYRGLAAFEREHRALFFGRGSETRAVLERLRQEPFILVTGDSGVGKSSLCRAGILPLIEEGALEPGRPWTVATFVPGRRPLEALRAALAPHLPAAAGTATADLSVWTDDITAAFRARQREAAGLLLFVDQLEELVTLADPGEAARLTELLVHLATTYPGFRVLATVRGDYLTRVASLPGLVDEIPRALFLLGALSPQGIREAIVGPAEAKGVRFESEDIVEALAAAGSRAEGGLPLVQFALAELWEQRDAARRLVTRAALDAMGGVEGALARHADLVLAALLPAQRKAAERTLIRLVTPEGTKARRTAVELTGRDRDSSAALEALVRGRLLIAREGDEGTEYELAHEALIRSWRTLREWLERDSDARLVLERLGRAAAEWERLEHADDALWQARQLGEAAIVRDDDVAPRELAFLEASRRQVRARRRRRVATLAAVPLALVALYGGVRAKLAADLARKVEVQLALAARASAAAQEKDEEVRSLEQDAYATFDAQNTDAGEVIWARAQSGSREVDEGYGEAAQALEAALALDASRSDVRERLAAVLFQRALVAERQERAEHLPELLRRLAVHDASGELTRRFYGTRAKLSVTSSPAGASVTLERAAPAGGPGARADTALVGTTPIAELPLEPGSWVLVLALPGRATVRYPVQVAHDEVRSVAVELPRLDEVPDGFVYVPAGRFLYGSTADEELRRDFFNTAPLHPVETGAYLIARYETTYGDWIEYLKTLGPKERAERTPRLDGGFARGLDLVELPHGVWQLTIQPASERYVVTSGQPLRYAGRKENAVQDWRRLPVSGISARDAEAYVAWLDGSGRVPGARLCTDVEWERAARGADRRIYPHGDVAEPGDFNFDETYGRSELAFGPDAVGLHPASKSPFGVEDLAGNVWELVRSSSKGEQWVARGGSYHQAQKTCRAMNREVIGEPTVRDLTLGLRVCASFGRTKVARER